MTIQILKVRAHERGLLFRDGAFERPLAPGRHLIAAPFTDLAVDRVSVREPWLEHKALDEIVRSGKLGSDLVAIDLKDHERAVVSIDGRVALICGPGVRALWQVDRTVKVEVVDARQQPFVHPDLAVVLAARGAATLLETSVVPAGWTGLLFQDGRLIGQLAPGVHALWRGEGKMQVLALDLREQTLDISGQEIMTADRVTLRLNALVGFRLVDPVKAATEVDDFRQALYRQAQLALRAIVGARDLDALLADKDGLVAELRERLAPAAEALGLELKGVGIRDVILPGEMKEILNRVIEAQKAAEVQLVTRREETAAIRSQANTARIFESNPTLMRLRELEVLEKVAVKANLSVVLGEGGLADRVMKLL
ncbi:MAG TPA: slipin family protein [Thermoanaerobaculia bacterium]|nr:slipin family protein [Thermoanaerobaculia bacterium]